MLVEVDLSAIVADMADGRGAGVDHHDHGAVVAFGAQDPYDMVRAAHLLFGGGAGGRWWRWCSVCTPPVKSPVPKKQCSQCARLGRPSAE